MTGQMMRLDATMIVQTKEKFLNALSFLLTSLLNVANETQKNT